MVYVILHLLLTVAVFVVCLLDMRQHRDSIDQYKERLIDDEVAVAGLSESITKLRELVEGHIETDNEAAAERIKKETEFAEAVNNILAYDYTTSLRSDEDA